MQTPRLSAFIFIVLAAPAFACSAASPSQTCDSPAPIKGRWDPAAPGYVVMVRKDEDLETVIARVARNYHFKMLALRSIHGFIVRDLNDEVLELLRCEEFVDYIERNQSTSTDDGK